MSRSRSSRPPNLREVASRARAVARAFGVEATLSTTTSIYVNAGTAHVVAAKAGIPAFGVEMGEGGRVEYDIVERGVAGVLNVLRSVGALRGPTEERPVPLGMKEFVQVRAKRGGLLLPSVLLGDHNDRQPVRRTARGSAVPRRRPVRSRDYVPVGLHRRARGTGGRTRVAALRSRLVPFERRIPAHGI